MRLDVQFLTMASMILGGFYLGMALDTFRRFTPYWKNKRILTAILEILFWLIQVLILFYILYLVNHGELRVYIFVAVFLGFAMYQALAAPLYKRLLEVMIRIILAIYRFLMKTVYYLIIVPIKWMITVSITTIIMVARLLLNILQFVLKVIWTPIFWILRGVYRLLPESIQKIVRKIAGFYSIMKNTLIKWSRFIVKRRK